MHPDEALARREIELIEAGDLEALEDLYAAHFVVHYPGRNPLSGSYAAREFLARFKQLLGDGTLTRELHDALGSDDHAVQLLRVTASARGRSHSWNAVAVSLVFTFSIVVADHTTATNEIRDFIAAVLFLVLIAFGIRVRRRWMVAVGVVGLLLVAEWGGLAVLPLDPEARFWIVQVFIPAALSLALIWFGIRDRRWGDVAVGVVGLLLVAGWVALGFYISAVTQ